MCPERNATYNAGLRLQVPNRCPPNPRTLESDFALHHASKSSVDCNDRAAFPQGAMAPRVRGIGWIVRVGVTMTCAGSHSQLPVCDGSSSAAAQGRRDMQGAEHRQGATPGVSTAYMRVPTWIVDGVRRLP